MPPAMSRSWRRTAGAGAFTGSRMGGPDGEAPREPELSAAHGSADARAAGFTGARSTVFPALFIIAAPRDPGQAWESAFHPRRLWGAVGEPVPRHGDGVLAANGFRDGQPHGPGGGRH